MDLINRDYFLVDYFTCNDSSNGFALSFSLYAKSRDMKDLVAPESNKTLALTQLSKRVPAITSVFLTASCTVILKVLAVGGLLEAALLAPDETGRFIGQSLFMWPGRPH